MLDYDTTMAAGRARYRDVLDELAAAGLDGVFTQTGGMCAAIEVLLDGGHTLLVTDAEDTLAWDRGDHRGWAVGLYPPDGARHDGPTAFDTVEDGSPQALISLVRRILRTPVRVDRRRD
jgi:hypothetical protein